MQLTTYVWGTRYVDDLICRERDGERLYSLADANWNVVCVTDKSGDVKERYVYDGFGKVSGLKSDWNRTFTGQVYDNETGLMLYRNRYYSPSLGRFVSRDPILYEAGDVNVYRYVGNGTCTNRDLLGLACSSTPCYDECKKLQYLGGGRAACEAGCATAVLAYEAWKLAQELRGNGWTEGLTPCPCSIETSGSGDKKCWTNPDPENWDDPTEEFYGYHEGASACMRSKGEEIPIIGGNNPFSGANQCCYSEDGKLITSGSGMGSADFWQGKPITFPGHGASDMIPADTAKKLDGGKWGDCSEEYLTYRPQVGTENCPNNPTPILPPKK